MRRTPQMERGCAELAEFATFFWFLLVSLSWCLLVSLNTLNMSEYVGLCLLC